MRKLKFIQMFSRKTWSAALVILTLFSLTAPALAWWSGWYDPGFVGSYSPGTGDRYKHGQWDSSQHGGSEVFGSRMKWNSTRGDGVRNYSNNRHDFQCHWWGCLCYGCYGYYTHDHTDMSRKLHGWGVASNMPNPKYDADNDNWWRDSWAEELEVVSVNESFPTTDSEYYFYSWFERKRSGNGDLNETPQISYSEGGGEYNTGYFDGNPQSLGYYTYSSRSQQGEPETLSAVAPYSTTISAGRFPVYIQGVEGALSMKVELDSSLQSGEELAAYASWASTYPVAELKKADVKRALAVITFNRPVSPGKLKRLLGQANQLPVEVVKAVYVDTTDPDPTTNVWTLQIEAEPGQDYVRGLNDLAAEIAANGFDEETGRHFEMQGVVALTTWLPLDAVDALNDHELVYLADASPSYLRMVASETRVKESVQSGVEEAELLRDGFSSSIYASFNDVYPEHQLFLTEKQR